MQIFELINQGAEDLRRNQIVSHKLDSEIILSSLLAKQRENLLTHLEQEVSEETAKNFKKLISRRSLKEPIAYILKSKEFWSKDFFVNSNTLIPRPETELLSEKVIEIFKNKKIFILDIGTGTGCILLSILSELKNSRGIGIDISKKAIDVARINTNKHNLSSRTKFYARQFSNIYGYKFDLIVSNPPYIKNSDIKNLSDDIKKFEPKIALDGGNDGLDVITKVIYKSRTILKKLGTLALEIGNGQHYKVSKILNDQGFRSKILVKDYQNNIRCIIARLEK
jgi:release factor glutamine methyltransferase